MDALNAGDLPRAEREFRGLLRELPGLVDAQEFLAVTLARENRLDEAESQLTEVIKERPESAEPYYNLGLVLLKKGDDQGTRSES